VDIFTAGSGHRLRTFKPSPSGAFIFIVDPSGTRIAFYNMWKADLKIYHLWSGAVISNCSRVGLPTSPQFPFSFRHDGRRLVAPRRDSRLLGCWDTTAGHRIFDLVVSSVPGIRFYCHSGNDHILVLNSEPAVTVFDSETGVPSLRFGLPGTTFTHLATVYGSDKFVVANDMCVICFRCSDGNEIWRFPMPCDNYVFSVLGPHGQSLLVVAENRKRIFIYGCAGGQELATLLVSGEESVFGHITTNPANGTFIAFETRKDCKSVVLVFDEASGAVLMTQPVQENTREYMNLFVLSRREETILM
jgi:hypothetical protein